MKKLLILLLCGHNLLWAQEGQIEKWAHEHYKTKRFNEAGMLYRQSADAAWMKALRKKHYYNAACSFSLADHPEQAFENLDLLIKNGYTDRIQLETDADLAPIRKDYRWAKSMAAIKSNVADNPHQSKYITTDIALFYRAFDLAIKDTAKARQIFRNEYFTKGSDGLQDFFVTKITDEQAFAKTVLKYKHFYADARNTLLQISAIKGPIFKHATTFKDLYPQAVFPNLYFVIGRFQTNGTISDNGLLIGAEQMSRTPETDTSQWKSWQHEWVMNFSQIPVTVAHELVHFNQHGMKRENTLLCYAMIEGSAEFVAELITGHTDGDYTAFNGCEQQIWQDFKSDMHQDLYNEWIQAGDARPRNGMYWAGYQIAKAYYDNALNKKQAVYDILHIQDYKAFYEQSQVERYIMAIN